MAGIYSADSQNVIFSFYFDVYVGVSVIVYLGWHRCVGGCGGCVGVCTTHAQVEATSRNWVLSNIFFFLRKDFFIEPGSRSLVRIKGHGTPEFPLSLSVSSAGFRGMLCQAFCSMWVLGFRTHACIASAFSSELSLQSSKIECL